MNSEERIIKERISRISHFIRKRFDIVSYILLALIVGISSWIRMRPMAINSATGKPGLWDVATNSWTLGPDLDPFLFLRWAKYIVEHGTLYAIDTLRYVPLGFETSKELVLLPQMIAWFHFVTTWFGNVSVDYSAALFPVIMFAFAIVAFFFMSQTLFTGLLGKKAAAIAALIACFFLAIQPILLPRTIAGIPEKEVGSLVFYFLGIFFFTKMFKTQKTSHSVIYGVLAGLATGFMGLIWGGYVYAWVILAFAAFLLFLLEKIDKRHVYAYAAWIVIASLTLITLSNRYSISGLLASTTTALPFFILSVMIIHQLLQLPRVHRVVQKNKLARFSLPLTALVITAIIGTLASILFFGPSFISDKVSGIYTLVINPTTDRVGVTVAENKQPYLTEWIGNFGPSLGGILLSFWITLFGMIYLFWLSTHAFKKRDRITLTSLVALFILAIPFSRYAESSMFNGQNGISAIALIAPVVLLAIAAIKLYARQKNEGKEYKTLSNEFLIIAAIFLVSLLTTRSAIRLVMMMAIPAALLIAFSIVSLSSQVIKKKKVASFLGIMVILVTFASLIAAYWMINSSITIAHAHVPSDYTRQWQQAMGWVRENTNEVSVFAHWWDYGYWVQSIGQRPTIVDGGNSYSYWNYQIGRYVLTTPDESSAYDVLYSHNASYLLIDSTDVGKYAAFSSIGSDARYDRRSWINSFVIDPSQTRQGKNTTTYVYQGGATLDEDISHTINGSRIFLPGVNDLELDEVVAVAGIGAVVATFGDNGSLEQPMGVYVYQNTLYQIPLRYAYDGTEVIDFGKGVEAGVFIMPAVLQTAQGGQFVDNGALLYLSERTWSSLVGQLYLLEQESDVFRVVHNEDDLFVQSLKQQGFPVGHFAYSYFNGFHGPITIWEIVYPDDVMFNELYIQSKIPENIWTT